MTRLILVAALLWHVWALAGAWSTAKSVPSGNDWASYYYALQVSLDGGNPYDTSALDRAARDDRTRRQVHPYFYPPTFLLAVAWTAPLDLVQSYRAWFWLDELFALLCGLVLWRWWRELGDALPVVLAAAIASLTAIPNNHVMGQVNLPVLFLVLVGLWQAERGRDGLGGALVGAACMMKMSPALFVAWWLLHRRWRPAVAACLAGVALSVATLPLMGAATQWHFYTAVLPGFGSGSYNGLAVPIHLFGNHSVPDLWNHAFPADGFSLSPTARLLTATSTVALVAGVGWLMRARPGDVEATATQVSAVALVMLLIPVYTYEHHLVWALPSVALLGTLALRGGVPRIPLILAWLVWAWPLTHLKSTWQDLGRSAPALAPWLRELKFASLVLLLGLVIARYARRREGR